MIYILNIKNAIKNDDARSVFENYYKKKSFTKEDRYYLLKKAKKDLALSANKTKEHYELFFRKQIKKILKASKAVKKQTTVT